MGQYFIIVNEVQQGPFTLDELRERGITSETLVWTEGMAQWVPAWQVEELRPLLCAARPVAAQPATPPPPPAGGASPAAGPSGATPSPATTPAGPPRKGGAWKWVALGVVAALLAVLALTNPSRIEHRRAVVDDLASTIDHAAGNPILDAIRGVGVGQLLQGPEVSAAVSEMLDYHNYILFSRTTATIHGHEVTVTTGYLGHVTVTYSLFGDLFGDHAARGASAPDDSQGQGAPLDGQAAPPSPDEGDATPRDGEAADGLARQVGDAAARKVTEAVKRELDRHADKLRDAVKKQAAEQTDSATADGIGAAIDAIFNLVKGL